MKTTLKLLLVALVLANVVGCASQQRDRRDAAHDPDPRTGQQLFDQIPAWDGAANKICCGHLRTCGPGQSPRC